MAEESNITHVAAKPFITQSVLNQQLIKLKNELGTSLFRRSHTNWHLVETGEIYIGDVKEIIRLKWKIYQIIHDLSDGRYGHLAVGSMAGRGINMFTRMCGTFHQLYPSVVIEPVGGIVKQLRKLISMGDPDLTFLTLTDKDGGDDLYEPIYDEELFLVAPVGHPLTGTRPEGGEGYVTMGIRRLEHGSFVLMDRRFTTNTMSNRIFMEAGFNPQTLFKADNNHTIISTIRANMCCSVLPYYHVKSPDQDFCCLHLPPRPIWQFAASYKKGHYLSRPAHSFIGLIEEQWGDEITTIW